MAAGSVRWSRLAGRGEIELSKNSLLLARLGLPFRRSAAARTLDLIGFKGGLKWLVNSLRILNGWIRYIRIGPRLIRARRIRSLISIRLVGLSENCDELPLVVLLTIVVHLNRFFIAVGRDSNDAASSYL